MKLLFDENLSPRLAEALAEAYPESAHVRTLGLRGKSDETIWERARNDGYIIISKDNDFRQLSFLHGLPPKVVWLSVGNAGTEAILRFLRERRSEIETFDDDPEASLLVLTLSENMA